MHCWPGLLQAAPSAVELGWPHNPVAAVTGMNVQTLVVLEQSSSDVHGVVLSSPTEPAKTASHWTSSAAIAAALTRGLALLPAVLPYVFVARSMHALALPGWYVRVPAAVALLAAFVQLVVSVDSHASVEREAPHAAVT